MYDVAVIGGGVIGTLSARALLRYKLSVCLIEKHSQVGYETSKANSGIVHGGYDCPTGTLKAKFNVPGNAMMEAVCDELDVEFDRCGSLVIAFDAESTERLKTLQAQGEVNGATGISIIDGDHARRLEPNLSPEVCAALWCQSAGIVSSYKLSRKGFTC